MINCVFFCLLGTSWVEVESPGKEMEALHVAVGMSVVWVVTKDYKVNHMCNALTCCVIYCDYMT